MSETINTENYQETSSGSGCGKAMLWLFFIAIILSCLCCGGFVGSSMYIAKALQDGLEDDPVVTQEKTVEAFGEMNLPDYIKPQAFLTVKIFGKDFGFAGFYSWNVANEGDSTALEEKPIEETPSEEDPFDDSKPIVTENKGVIVFYSLSDFLKGNEQEFVDGISQGLIDNKNKDVTVKRAEKIAVNINGKIKEFTFSWMEESKSVKKNPFLMVSGSFESKTGKDCNVIIYLPGEPSPETVTNVLENIQ